MALSEQDWAIRRFVYRHFIEQERPPTFAETARRFGLSDEAARAAYVRLHDAHLLFVEAESGAVRMANPLSALPTPYQIEVGERRYYASCAWDALGVPAMLRADAQITARDPLSHEPLRFAIEQRRLTPEAGWVHVPLPPRDWYHDQVHT